MPNQLSTNLLDKINHYKSLLYAKMNTDYTTYEGKTNRRAIEIGYNDQIREATRLAAMGLNDEEIIEEAGFVF